MTYVESPELIASRLRGEINSSESKTHSRINDAERRLDTRIHELEMKLISSGAFHRRDCREDCPILGPPIMFFVFMPIIFMLIICLGGHSRDSTNTEAATPATRPQISAPQTAPAPEEGK